MIMTMKNDAVVKVSVYIASGAATAPLVQCLRKRCHVIRTYIWKWEKKRFELHGKFE